MATEKAEEIMFENGVSNIIYTNSKHNSITIVPFGNGICQLQVKGTPDGKWVDVSLFDGVNRFQADIDTEDRLWQGSVANTYCFRINPETCTFDKVEARFI